MVPDNQLYTIEAITPKVIELKHTAFLWNITLPTLTDIINNPFSAYPVGSKETVSMIAHHSNGKDYYLLSDTTGFDVYDCQDEVPPPALPPTLTSSLINALPPVVAPNPSDTFAVKTLLSGYASPGKALASSPPSITTFKPATYYVYSRLNGMVNITQTLGVPGAWVNPTLNIAPVTVAPLPPPPVPAKPVAPVVTGWKASYQPLYDDRKPEKFVFLTNHTIEDIGGQRPPITAKRGDPIAIYGTFVKDGIEYYRPKLEADTLFQFWFGIPVRDLNTGTDIIEPYQLEAAIDPMFSYSKKVTALDKVYLVAKTGEKWLDGIKKKI